MGTPPFQLGKIGHVALYVTDMQALGDDSIPMSWASRFPTYTRTK